MFTQLRGLFSAVADISALQHSLNLKNRFKAVFIKYILGGNIATFKIDLMSPLEPFYVVLKFSSILMLTKYVAPLK